MELYNMSNKLYVGNLPYNISTDDLSKLFSTCGDVIDIHIPTDHNTHKARGFAFVELESEQSALDAVTQLNGTNLGGREIKVTIALNREKSEGSNNSPRMYAKNKGTGDCQVCLATNVTIYGFDSTKIAICASCISSLSKAARQR